MASAAAGSPADGGEIVVGGLVIGRKLGAGAFGTVHECVETRSGEKFAVKILDRLRVSEVADVERVSREFFILTSMEHPNVIRLHRVEHQGGTLYLVMELAPGGSLKMLLRRAGKAGSNAVRRRRRRLSSAGVPALVPPRVASAPSSPIAGNPVRPRRPSAAAALGRSGVGLGEPAARWLFQQLCRAVSYCHRHRVVHRDLKPDNVLVGAGGRLKVADFGLSIAVSAGGRASSPVGTPLYSAPEVLFGLQDVKEACARRGDATCDGRPASGHRTGSEAEDGLSGYAASAADVWSLGVMLFELCFGALPFPAQTRRDLRRMVLERRLVVRNDAAVPAQPLPAPPAAALRDDLHAPPVIVNVAPRQMSPHHSPTGTPAARSRCSSRAGDAPPHALTVDVAETSASGPLRDLLASMLALDPSLRPPIDSVLAHPWMRTVASALPHLASGVSLVPTPTSTTAASRADPDASALGLALPSFSGASDGNASPTSSILGGAEHHPSSRRPHRGTDPDADEGTAILAALGVEGPEWLAGFAAIVLAPSETSTSDGGAACSDAGSQRSCGEGRSSVGPSAATGSATPAAGSGSAGAARVSDAGGPVDSISRAEAENKALYANPNLAIDMDGDVDVAIPSPAAGKTKSESRGLGAPWSVPVAGAAVAALSSSSAGGGAGAASRPRAATAAAAPDDHGEGLVPAAPPSHRMASGPSPLQHAHRQALRPIGHARHTRDRRDHDDGASAPASRASSRDGSSRRLLGLGRDPSPPTVVGGVSSGHPLDRDTTAQAGTGGLTQASGPLAGPLAGMLPAMAQPSFRSRLRRVQSGKSSASGSTGGGPRGTTPTSGAPPPM